jgi:hypothetical protein
MATNIKQAGGVVFPQDAGFATFTSTTGDFDDAALFALLARASMSRDYVDQGMTLTPDYTVPQLEISPGIAALTISSLAANQSGSSHDGVLAVNSSAITSADPLALTDAAVNEIYLVVNYTTNDDIEFHAITDGSIPSSPNIKIGEVDTSTDTLDQDFNRGFKLDKKLFIEDQSADPTKDGEITNNGGSIVVQSGGQTEHLDKVSKKGVTTTIEGPSDIEDFTVFRPVREANLIELRHQVTDNTGSLDWTLRHGPDRTATGTEIVTGGFTSTTTEAVVTTFDVSTIPIDDYVWLETTAKSGAVDEVTLRLKYD